MIQNVSILVASLVFLVSSILIMAEIYKVGAKDKERKDAAVARLNKLYYEMKRRNAKVKSARDGEG